MTKKNIKSIVAALLLMPVVGAFTSCDDFLDQVPDERVEISTVPQVLQLLTSAYPTSNYGWLCELSSDNMIDINANFMATQNSGNELLVHYNLTSSDRMDDEIYKFEPVKSSTSSDSPFDIWESFYYSIATANFALQYLDEIKEDAGLTDSTMSNNMKAAYGEAYLIRAYCHFILVNIFSQAYKNDEASKADIGIPYVTEVEDKVFGDYDRSNVTETYNKIEADLLKGLELISDINFEVAPKYHFNTNAAHAFAARFYLFKRQYEKVIEHADIVLGTDPEILPTKLMSYAGLDSCQSSKDFATVWQGPQEANNLMLFITYSTQGRNAVGSRYATAGKALRDIEYHLGPNWRWYMMPCASIGGNFWDGTSDHGYFSGRICEQFEYTDKVAGIGYAHVIRREFTGCELLLERIEAKLLKDDPDKEGAIQDMIAYEASRMSFTPETYAYRTAGGAMEPLTKELIDKWYDPTKEANLRHSNVLADWNFTQNVSPEFRIADSLYIYMNCLNDMRRYEVAWSGHRFFDLKRMGIEYSHVYGEKVETGVVNDTIVMTANDKRRAIELPQEVLVAGMPSSYEPAKVSILDNRAVLAPVVDDKAAATKKRYFIFK